jgi:hypothetical protein
MVQTYLLFEQVLEQETGLLCHSLVAPVVDRM